MSRIKRRNKFEEIRRQNNTIFGMNKSITNILLVIMTCSFLFWGYTFLSYQEELNHNVTENYNEKTHEMIEESLEHHQSLRNLPIKDFNHYEAPSHENVPVYEKKDIYVQKHDLKHRVSSLESNNEPTQRPVHQEIHEPQQKEIYETKKKEEIYEMKKKEEIYETKKKEEIYEMKKKEEIYETKKKNKNIENEDNIHIIFSTTCSKQENWESIILFYSAMQVEQPGAITRIVSGCTREEMLDLMSKYKKLGPQFNLHFTKSQTAHDKEDNEKVPHANTPQAVAHWLEHGKYTESVVAFIRSDFLFLDKITPYISSMSNLIHSSNLHSAHIPDKIIHGEPVAQGYNLAQWTQWPEKGVVCPENSPCLTITNNDIEKYYAVGPPYILHVDDWKKIVPSWLEITKELTVNHDDTLSEIYAYSIAAINLHMPHTILSNFMVSNPNIFKREGWELIDQAHDFCGKPLNQLDINLPTWFYYCGVYRSGEWALNKGRIPDNILDCNAPLLREPPSILEEEGYIRGIMEYERSIREKKGMPQISDDQLSTSLKRNSFALCTIYQEINMAISWYRRNTCGDQEINLEKSYKVIRSA